MLNVSLYSVFSSTDNVREMMYTLTVNVVSNHFNRIYVRKARRAVTSENAIVKSKNGISACEHLNLKHPT